MSDVDAARDQAARALIEATSSYYAYATYAAQGRLRVHADEDPQDIVAAARANVADQLAACQALGFTDDELEQLLRTGQASSYTYPQPS